MPYVDPPSTGSIAGIIGAGGNVGAIGFGLFFRQMEYEKAFMTMSFVILGAATLSFFIKIKGHAPLLCGTDSPVAINRRHPSVPGPVPEKVEDGSGSAAPVEELTESESK